MTHAGVRPSQEGRRLRREHTGLLPRAARLVRHRAWIPLLLVSVEPRTRSSGSSAAQPPSRSRGPAAPCPSPRSQPHSPSPPATGRSHRHRRDHGFKPRACSQRALLLFSFMPVRVDAVAGRPSEGPARPLSRGPTPRSLSAHGASILADAKRMKDTMDRSTRATARSSAWPWLWSSSCEEHHHATSLALPMGIVSGTGGQPRIRLGPPTSHAAPRSADAARPLFHSGATACHRCSGTSPGLAAPGESPVCSRAAVVGPLGFDETPLYWAVPQVSAGSRGAGERAGLLPRAARSAERC